MGQSELKCSWLTNSDLSALRFLTKQSSEIRSGVRSIWWWRIMDDLSGSDKDFLITMYVLNLGGLTLEQRMGL